MDIVALAQGADLIIFQFVIATEIKGIVNMEQNVNLATRTGILIIILGTSLNIVMSWNKCFE